MSSDPWTEDVRSRTVTYTCAGYSYERTVQVRNAIDLVGDAHVVVAAGTPGP